VKPDAVLPALARIGGSEVVAALAGLRWEESGQQQYVYEALARIGTPEALDQLAAAGAYRHLAQVGDPRASDIAGSQLRYAEPAMLSGAVSLLAQLPDPKWVPDLIAAYDRVPTDRVRLGILYALLACGATDEARRRAPDLLNGPYGNATLALLQRVGRTERPGL
jgi:HEAT repeat protein